MANSYFQFKRFTIQQDRCGMKVSTDGCLQGAWTPIDDSVKVVVDIGAGTGLLSLMLAQRSDAIQVDAIELDVAATQQAMQNAAASPWSDRVKLINADVRTHSFDNRYDLAICNPPFFSNSLLGDKDLRNQARHTVTLPHLDLLNVLNRALKPDGYASIMLPIAEHETWDRLLQKSGWHIHRRLFIHPYEKSSANRLISLCSRNELQCTNEERLVIYSNPNQYSPQASELLRPFYLKL